MRYSAIIVMLIAGSARAQAPDPDAQPSDPASMPPSSVPVSDPAPASSDAMPAAFDGFELQLGGGYLRGAGDIAGAVETSINDMTDGGGYGELSLGYRVSPEGSFGVFGTVGGFAHGGALAKTTDVLVASAGLFAQFHAAPSSDVDPWIGFGTGWRMLELDDASSPTTIYHGLELARVQVGIDLRSAPELALAPVITVGLDMFMWQDTPDRGMVELRDPRLSAFISAGFQLRIDPDVGMSHYPN